MAKVKAKECKRCGCDRQIILSGVRVTKQTKDMSASYTLVNMCLPCLLRTIGATDAAKFDNLPDEFLKVVSNE